MAPSNRSQRPREAPSDSERRGYDPRRALARPATRQSAPGANRAPTPQPHRRTDEPTRPSADRRSDPAPTAPRNTERPIPSPSPRPRHRWTNGTPPSSAPRPRTAPAPSAHSYQPPRPTERWTTPQAHRHTRRAHPPRRSPPAPHTRQPLGRHAAHHPLTLGRIALQAATTREHIQRRHQHTAPRAGRRRMNNRAGAHSAPAIERTAADCDASTSAERTGARGARSAARMARSAPRAAARRTAARSSSATRVAAMKADSEPTGVDRYARCASLTARASFRDMRRAERFDMMTLSRPRNAIGNPTAVQRRGIEPRHKPESSPPPRARRDQSARDTERHDRTARRERRSTSTRRMRRRQPDRTAARATARERLSTRHEVTRHKPDQHHDHKPRHHEQRPRDHTSQERAQPHPLSSRTRPGRPTSWTSNRGGGDRSRHERIRSARAGADCACQ